MLPLHLYNLNASWVNKQSTATSRARLGQEIKPGIFGPGHISLCYTNIYIFHFVWQVLRTLVQLLLGHFFSLQHVTIKKYMVQIAIPFIWTSVSFTYFASFLCFFLLSFKLHFFAPSSTLNFFHIFKLLSTQKRQRGASLVTRFDLAIWCQ